MTLAAAPRNRPGAGPTRRRHAATSAVTGVALVAAIVLYYAAVLGAFGEISHVTVGIAFLFGTDGLLLGLTLAHRRSTPPPEPSGVDRDRDGAANTDVSAIIACYNGSDVIGETIEHLLPHIPAERIIVVSDCSTDDTVSVAHGYGVTVVENRFNRNKALSINRVAPLIGTDYTLVLDDDTHVGSDPLPVELLRSGYAAVAFEVMPMDTATFVNDVQSYEYRKSMILGKELVSAVGAVANVSGAVGLFRTRDLRRQASTHSGHFPGEDLQRTILTHLQSDGSGVAYSPNRVETLAPATWRSLFTQRAFKWSTADHELVFLNIRLLLNPHVHPLLRVERAYSLFVLLTEPIRMLFFFTLFLSPLYFLFVYCLYLPLELLAWWRLGRVDPLHVLLFAPLHNLFKMAARFVGHFYWFKTKWEYLVSRGLHRLVPGRNLRAEYTGVTALLAIAWAVALVGAAVQLM